MKLLRATFHNFRLLRDLSLDFSVDPDKRLTVIRAANESGKTTILHALQWALYGDRALPGKGQDFRLQPLDWDPSEGTTVNIAVAVEYEVTTHRLVRGERRESSQKYQLVRAVQENIDDYSRRSASTVRLFALHDTGASPIEPPEPQIKEHLPPELREVFFTDGDRALSFIEADAATITKRERVQNAIRSLLGLGVIEDAVKHVRKTEADANRRAKRIVGSGELTSIASRLEEIEKDRESQEDQLKDAKSQFVAFDQKLVETDQKISAALKKGDKESLEKNRAYERKNISQLDKQLKEASKAHSAIFRSRTIATELLLPLLGRAFGELSVLHDQGKIPSTTIPVLAERLSGDTCFCGETLAADDTSGRKRRAHIEELIERTRRSDEIQETLTDLYYEANALGLDGTEGNQSWSTEYQAVVTRRDGLEEMRDSAGRRLRSLEQQIDELPNTDIRALRELQRDYKTQRDNKLSRRSTIATQLAGLKHEKVKLETRRDQLLKEQKTGNRILAELAVTKDIKGVLQTAYEQITTAELQKVSALMNKIFLEMIGADDQQKALIRRAEISPVFDIMVYGPKDRKLNPDRDLNGASRRALTLAFILALTKVSEVAAPNVIDTPLGMTSGYVKSSILQNSVRESSQLILFLTHDEILGCEQIIDKEAGAVYTLTNTAHYPRMLVNDPRVEERMVIRCDCDHRSDCMLCQRRVESSKSAEMVS